MGDYYSVRIWRLKAGHTGAELEALASSGYLEMQRWIPGVKHISLVHEAYSYWRQVEEEAPDYWERYAAILMQWERICQLVGGYAGEKVLDVNLDESIQG